MTPTENATALLSSYLASWRLVERFALARRILSLVATAYLRENREDEDLWHTIRAGHSALPDEESRKKFLILARNVEKRRPPLDRCLTILVGDATNSRNFAEISTVASLIFQEIEYRVTQNEFAHWFSDRLNDTASFGPAASELVTSPLIAQLLTGLVADPDARSFYDPCCGVGNLLAAANNRMPDAELFGIDPHPVSWAFTRLRLYLLGKSPAAIELGDALFGKPIGPTYFDRIVCDPPSGAQTGSWSVARPDLGPRHAPRAETAFLEHCLKFLSPQGRAAVLVNQSVLGRKGYEQRVRLRIASWGQIEAVVGLPAGIAPWLQNELAIVVLTGAAVRSDVVRFVDGARIFPASRKKILDESDVETLLNISLGRDLNQYSTLRTVFDVLNGDQFKPSTHFRSSINRVDYLDLFRQADERETAARELRHRIDGLLERLSGPNE